MGSLDREEYLLNAIKKGNVDLTDFKPLNREEYLLKTIAEKPSGGGGGDMEYMTKAEMLEILRGEEI